jgi:mycothiol synthase
MTTLKKRPAKSGVNFRKSTFVQPSFTPQLPPVHQLSTTTFFAEIVDLVKLNEPSGQLDEDTLVCDLQLFFEAADFDSRNFRLWRNKQGKLIGFGQLFISEQNQEVEGYLYFDVHPMNQGFLETSILQWSKERMNEVAKNNAISLKLHTHSSKNRSDRCFFLEKQGFTYERSFLTMTCSLNQAFSPSSLPTGFRLQQLSGERDIKAWVEMFNESFIDHWDHHPLTVTTVESWLKNPHYKPEFNWVAVAPEGTFAAFCVGYINQEENARNGANEGWIKLLGTRRGFRKLGLGRAILLNCMKQLQAEKIEQVKLGVDAQSLTSATRLYEAVGFKPVNTWLSYFKDIQS